MKKHPIHLESQSSNYKQSALSATATEFIPTPTPLNPEAVPFTPSLTQTFANPLPLSNSAFVTSHSLAKFRLQAVEPSSPHSSNSSNPDSPNSKLILSRRLESAQYLNIARDHFKNHRSQDAIIACNASIAKKAQNPDAYHHRGIVYKAMGEYGKAKADWLIAENQGFTGLKKPIGSLYREMAFMCIETREYEWGLKYLLEAETRGIASAKKDLANLYLIMAKEHIDNNKYTEATACLKQAQGYNIDEFKKEITDLQRGLDNTIKMQTKSVGAGLSQSSTSAWGSSASGISVNPVQQRTFRDVLLNAKPITQSSLASIPVSENKPEIAGSQLLPKGEIVQANRGLV